MLCWHWHCFLSMKLNQINCKEYHFETENSKAKNENGWIRLILLSPLSKTDRLIPGRLNTHWCNPLPSKLSRSEMANWFSTRLSSDTVTPVSNKQSLSSSEPTDSLNQTQKGRFRLLMEKICLTQSHLSSELLFSCGIWGFVRAELSRSDKRRGIVGFNCAHRHTHAAR